MEGGVRWIFEGWRLVLVGVKWGEMGLISIKNHSKRFKECDCCNLYIHLHKWRKWQYFWSGQSVENEVCI